MMISKKTIYKNIDTISLFILWLAIFIAPVLLLKNIDDDGVEWKRVYFTWLSMLPFFILFLINHFILLKFFLFKQKKVLYFVSVILIIGFVSVGWHFLEENRKSNTPRPEKFQEPPPITDNAEMRTSFENHPPRIPMQKPNPGPFPFPPYLITLLMCFLLVGFDTGLRLIVRWSGMEQERTLLEKENVKNQLAFLRNQVSPHFLMNTLNNIHILIDLDTEEAKEAVIKLSKLMRYLLYDSELDQVPLDKELEFIISYVNLMKIRYSDKVDIKINMPEEVPDKEIPPLLFTSFVENAFKHGISYQSTCFINISFSIKNDNLHFVIRNSIPEFKQEHPTSGIGLANSKKRLDILFGKKYNLDIKDDHKEYKLTLSFPV